MVGVNGLSMPKYGKIEIGFCLHWTKLRIKEFVFATLYVIQFYKTQRIIKVWLFFILIERHSSQITLKLYNHFASY